MTFTNLLQQNKAAIEERWLADIYSTYPKNVAEFLEREKDPFANPVGTAFRTSIPAILEAFFNNFASEDICRNLQEIIKIRAIQNFSPSEAVSFVFLLKQSARTVLSTQTGPFKGDLITFDKQVDQIALFAFDIYVKCRESMYEMRVDEVKRSVTSLLKRVTGPEHGLEWCPEPDGKPTGN